MTTSFLVTPGRPQFVVGKLLIAAICGAVLAVIMLVATVIGGGLTLAARGGSFSDLLHQIPAVAPGMILVFALFAILGVGVGSVLTNQVAAIIVVPRAGSSSSRGSWSAWSTGPRRWVPTGAATAAANLTRGRGADFGLFNWWQGAPAHAGLRPGLRRHRLAHPDPPRHHLSGGARPSGWIDGRPTPPPTDPRATACPTTALDADEVLATMAGLRVDDRDWRGGRVFSLVYSAGDDVHDLLERAATLYSAENALNTDVFPSLGRMQQDIVDHHRRPARRRPAAGRPSDAEVRGYLTSGGTESLLQATKTARDWGRARARTSTSPTWCWPPAPTPPSRRPPTTSTSSPAGYRSVPTTRPTWTPWPMRSTTTR